MPEKNFRPTVLIINDGWGVAPDSEGNAITRAKTPHFSKWVKTYPAMTIKSSGVEVGLSWGEMGNSEVGHLNIGAGRVYYQTLPRIGKEIGDKSFFQNPVLQKVIAHARAGGKLHLLGIVSAGNVHGSDEHLNALLDLCATEKIQNVFVHVILDGRDTKFDSGKMFVERLLAKMKACGVGKIATMGGRFFAMDRDNRWDRIEKMYRAMTEGAGEKVADPLVAIQGSYDKKIYDEEFVPVVVDTAGQVAAGDTVLFFNFRPDRSRELTQAFVLPEFDKFQREKIDALYFATMTEYEKGLPVDVCYPPDVIQMTLAETISRAGKTQFHVAETEKYAHVTFFLNGTIEKAWPGEDRLVIPSPKVASYAEAPEMSAMKVADAAVAAIESEKYDFVVINFANADMVGHTGDLAATIKGVEAVDKAMDLVVAITLAKQGAVFITADHGNGEEVLNLRTHDKDKEHSTNAIPFLCISNAWEGQTGPSGDVIEGDLSLMSPVGMLADVAPTILKAMGVMQPGEMTGRALI
jgi:2,3-bisphosphoglycerate-independent phosphoglycerate mutase